MGARFLTKSLLLLAMVGARDHVTGSDLFRCHAPGLYPHPYDCRSYFNCTENREYPTQGTLVKCPNEAAYDPLSQECRLPSSDRVCAEGPVPQCTAAAQYGAQQDTPGVYYLCVRDRDSNTLVPRLFKCVGSTEVFVNGRCQQTRAGSTTSDETTATTEVATTASSQTTTEVPTTTSSQTTTTTEVPTTTSSQTTTTTEVPTTTTSQTTTTTEVPTTTSSQTTTEVPTTTTTPVSTTAPYYCVKPGTVVPDPADCHSFYYCTLDLLQIHYKCRIGYYYNKPTGTCVKGSC